MESVQWPVCTEEDTIALPPIEEGAAWFIGAGGVGLDILKALDMWTQCGFLCVALTGGDETE